MSFSIKKFTFFLQVLVLTPVEFIIEILGILLIKTTKEDGVFIQEISKLLIYFFKKYNEIETKIEKFEPLMFGFLVFAIVLKVKIKNFSYM